MPVPSLDRRIAALEEIVNALNELPARVGAVETQLVEMRRDIAAFRSEFASMKDELRIEIRAGDDETRRHMRVLHEEVISRIALLQEGMGRDHARNARSRSPRSPKRR